jgi:hypothetical protein
VAKGSLCPTCWCVWLGMNVSGEDCHTYNMGALRYESIAATPELDKDPGPCVLCGKVNTLSRVVYVKEKSDGICSSVHSMGIGDSSRYIEGSKVNPMLQPAIQPNTFWRVLFEFREGPVMQWHQEEHTVFLGLDETLMESEVDDRVIFTVESVEDFARLDFAIDYGSFKAVPLAVIGRDLSLSL